MSGALIFKILIYPFSTNHKLDSFKWKDYLTKYELQIWNYLNNTEIEVVDISAIQDFL